MLSPKYDYLINTETNLIQNTENKIEKDIFKRDLTIFNTPIFERDSKIYKKHGFNGKNKSYYFSVNGDDSSYRQILNSKDDKISNPNNLLSKNLNPDPNFSTYKGNLFISKKRINF